MKTKTVLLFLSATLCSLWVACSNKNGESIGNGSFEANEVLVSAQADGEILEWNISEGSQVQADEVVGQIDSTMLHLQKVSLQKSGSSIAAGSPNVSTQTAALQQKIAELKRERARTLNLIKADVAPKKQLDDIEASLQTLQSQLDAQRSTLNKSKAQISAQGASIETQVAQLERQIEKSQVKAPISGLVLQNYVNKGELAGAGRPLFSVAATDTLTLRAYVVASDLSKIKVGDKLEVRVDGEEGKMKSYQGQVQWISSQAEFTPKAVQTKSERDHSVYAVKVAVPNDGQIRIGMYGEIWIP